MLAIAAERGGHQFILDSPLATAALGIANGYSAGGESGRGHGASRVEASKGGEHTGIDQMGGGEITIDCGGILRVHNNAGRHVKGDGIEDPGVHRDGGIRSGEHREQGDGLCCGAGYVDWAAGLAVRAAEIETQVVTGYSSTHVKADGCGRVCTVMVETALGFKDAIRPGGQFGPHPGRGSFNQTRHGL